MKYIVLLDSCLRSNAKIRLIIRKRHCVVKFSTVNVDHSDNHLVIGMLINGDWMEMGNCEFRTCPTLTYHYYYYQFLLTLKGQYWPMSHMVAQCRHMVT